jgi:hypothetical protein
MSGKFKPDDMVEIISNGNAKEYVGVGKPGVIGTIIKYMGRVDGVLRGLPYWIENAWEIKTAFGSYICVEEQSLRLIPGGSESKEPGSWEGLPWSPYRQKVT